MLLLDRQSVASSQSRGGASRPGGEASRFHLRQRSDGQLVELPPGKTTIGSSPRCNVRIEQPGVQPLHCLIVHAPEGLTVRSWAGNTRLNGEPFSESALAVGDCLNVGPVEFEIVEPVPAAPVEMEKRIPVAESKVGERIITARDLARSRGRKLLATLRQERVGNHDLQKQVADLQEAVLQAIEDGNGVSGILDSTKAELAALRKQLADHKELTAAREELASRNEELEEKIRDFSSRIERLTQENANVQESGRKLARDHAALTEQHRHLVAENSRLQKELASQNTAICAERDELRRQHDELLANSREEARQLTTEKTILCKERDDLRRQNEQLLKETGEKVRELTDQNAALCAEKDQLLRQHEEVVANSQEEVRQLTVQKTTLCSERDELRRNNEQLQTAAREEVRQLGIQNVALCRELDQLRQRNEQLVSEARGLAAERGTISDERTALYQERNELRQVCEKLQARVGQLNEESSALAVAKFTVEDQRDALGGQVAQLQARLAELSDMNVELTAAQATLSDEQNRLQNENKRLAELEREMRAAVASRESASEELYRALLQIAELKEREEQNRSAIAAYDSLASERDHLQGELDELKEQISRQYEERTAIEGAWQALSNEAAELGDSRQRLAEENSQLVASLEEARQQLENARNSHAALESTAAELEQERVARKQAAEAAAAAIAKHEQQLADLARDCAESASKAAQLEQRLAAAVHAQEVIERERKEWLHERDEANARSTEQFRRIRELEARLTSAEAAAAEAAVTAEAARNAGSAPVQQPVSTPVMDSDAPPTFGSNSPSSLSNEAPAAFDWSTVRGEPESHEFQNLSHGDDALRQSSFDEPVVSEAVWGNNSSAEEWHATDATQISKTTADESPRLPVETAQSAGDWLLSAEAAIDSEGSGSWGVPSAEQTSAKSGAFDHDEAATVSPRKSVVWPTQAEASVAGEPTDGGASSGVFSGWNQSASQQNSCLSESTTSGVTDSTDRVAASEVKPASKADSTSFIERYSHMFTDDGPAADEKPSPAVEQESFKPRVTGIVRSDNAALPFAKNDEEESIEQYMAKLLQRVRGDSSSDVPASTGQPTGGPLKRPAQAAADQLPIRSGPLEMPPAPSEAVHGDVAEAQKPVYRERAKRNVAAPAPTTDLGALRALANETARRAISRHELRKHRRNAVTKVIVSTLAGVTSLWLMLDSPNWHDIQFITACVSLIVAAIWAGETYRTLLESLRAAAYDGPESGLDENVETVEAELPIDIENRQ